MKGRMLLAAFLGLALLASGALPACAETGGKTAASKPAPAGAQGAAPAMGYPGWEGPTTGDVIPETGAGGGGATTTTSLGRSLGWDALVGPDPAGGAGK